MPDSPTPCLIATDVGTYEGAANCHLKRSIAGGESILASNGVACEIHSATDHPTPICHLSIP